MDTKSTQKRIIDNKISKGFPTDNLEQEFLLLHGEVAEAYVEVLRGDKKALAEELADVAIYLLGIAELNDVDLGKEIERKLSINEARVYVPNELGTFRKITHVYDGDKELGKVIGSVDVVDGKINPDEILRIIKLYDESTVTVGERIADKLSCSYDGVKALIYKTEDGYDIAVMNQKEIQYQASIQK